MVKKILLLCLEVDIVLIFFSLKTINLHFELPVSGTIVLFRQNNSISNNEKIIKIKCIRFYSLNRSFRRDATMFKAENK